MSKLRRYLIFLAPVSVFLLSGCNGTIEIVPSPVPNSYSVLAFSDIHFNPFYDPSLYSRLAAADPAEWAGIFQASAITAPSGWGTDTNYPLFKLALSAIQRNRGNARVILFPGDLIGHYFSTYFYKEYYHTASPPSPPSPEAVEAMEAFTDKTVAFVTSQIRSAAGTAPVIFAVGNSDSYTGYGPDTTFLSHNWQTLYLQLLNGGASQQTFVNTFTTGGYYAAQPLGSNLLVLVLNTNPFAPTVPGDNSPAVNAELTWLDSALASARRAGQKVWILMHVPPGADTVTTSRNAAKAGTPNHLTRSTAAMMWVADYQSSFLQVLAKYPGLVTLLLGAHTHMDEYRILSANNVLEQLPGITPCFGENPAFKIFTIDENSSLPTDYQSLNYDLAAMPVQFSNFYKFSTTYTLQGALQSSLASLYPELVANGTMRATYTYQYNSGNDSIIPGTKAGWNSINRVNWPIFACGVSKVDEQDFVDCVNSYQ
ncbi:MAG TPA: hypothetical protein VGZ29_09415 [Terriglobia bacterium]|nr:hypothetical protein [Terriglobia bacterium]